VRKLIAWFVNTFSSKYDQCEIVIVDNGRFKKRVIHSSGIGDLNEIEGRFHNYSYCIKHKDHFGRHETNDGRKF
jgi:hypothetical protein